MLALHGRFNVCDGSRLAAAFLQHIGADPRAPDGRRPAKCAESGAVAGAALQAAAPVAAALTSGHAGDHAAEQGGGVVRRGVAAAAPALAGKADRQAPLSKPADRGMGEGKGAGASGGSASSDSVDTLAGEGMLA